MKKSIPFLLCTLLFSSFSLLAQGNFGNNTQNQNGAEMDREMERRKDDYEKTKQKNLEESLATMKEELQLDELQFIAIKQIIAESIRNERIIMKKEESNEDKVKAVTSLRETTDAKIKALLNKVQIEKYDVLKTTVPKKKKKKK